MLFTFFEDFLIFILSLEVFCPQVCLCTTRMQCPQTPEEGVGSSGSGVTGGCELPGGCVTRTCVFCKSSMYSSQLNYLQHSLCFLFAVVDVCILRSGFAMRPRLVRNWGALLSPGCTSLFLSLPFVLQKPSFTHLPQEQAPHCFCSLPLASFWESSVTLMLPQLPLRPLPRCQCPYHCWFAVGSAVCPSSSRPGFFSPHR